MEIKLLTTEFIAPSGHKYTIREENGEDEEVLSNQADAKGLMNIHKFIAGLVVNTDFTTSGHLLVEDVKRLPVLDRYAIIFQSRIFSLGDTLEFSYEWTRRDGTKNVVNYEQDLHEFLFDNYGVAPTEEELAAKPDAIPYYPDYKDGPQEFTLSSGKIISWEYLTGIGEQYIIQLPDNQRTRGVDLMARNLKLNVDGNWEKVTNFRGFSVREMAEMRNHILSMDPVFSGTTDIENPDNPQEVFKYPVIFAPTFFYLTEA